MAIDTNNPQRLERRSTDNYSTGWIIAILAILGVIIYAGYNGYYSDSDAQRMDNRMTVDDRARTVPTDR